MTIIYVKIIAAIAAGMFAGLAAVYIFNRMPASWLCDYGETPPPELTDRSVQRVKGWPWRWIYAGGMACLCLRLIFTEIHHIPSGFEGMHPETAQLIAQCQFTLAALLACWALLIIGLADLKYMIIPDQFVIMLAVAAMGFLPLQEGLKQPLGGMLIGGGVMLVAAMLGGAAFGKEVMGFGDVKLCAAAGLVLGIRGTIFMVAAGSLAAGAAAAAGLARKTVKLGDRRPMGPYLAGAAIFYIFIVWPFLI